MNGADTTSSVRQPLPPDPDRAMARRLALTLGLLLLGACAAVSGLDAYQQEVPGPESGTPEDAAAPQEASTSDTSAPEDSAADATTDAAADVAPAPDSPSTETGACPSACAPGASGGGGADAARHDSGAAMECCGDACVDTSSDRANCGRCGVSCTADGGGAACCSSACVDIAGDLANCGSCGHACAPVHVSQATCSSSVCGYDTCQAGYADCDGDRSNGCEVNLQTDPSHCGACTNACTTGLCGTSISGWSASAALWRTNGSATIGSGQLGSRTAILTPLTAGAAGTIVYKNPIVTDSFTATFDVYLGGGNGADGMGFMWQTTGATALGASGGCLGMCGLPGYGVELDTYNNNACGDPNTNHISVDQLSGCSTSNAFPLTISANSLIPVLDGAMHTVVVQMSGGMVSVTLDGASSLSNVALPGFTSGTAYYYGFAGGNGGQYDYHEVSPNLTITFPTPRCL